MSSLRQIDANRRNAQKSTGPTTEEGKARSSQNALTHGVFAADLISERFYENSDAFFALRQGLIDHYSPADDAEMQLVDTAATLRWRRARLFRAETAYVDNEVQKTLEHAVRSGWNRYLPTEGEERKAASARLGYVYASEAKTLNLLSLYDSRLERGIDKAIAQLDRILKERSKNPPPPPEAPLPNELPPDPDPADPESTDGKNEPNLPAPVPNTADLSAARLVPPPEAAGRTASDRKNEANLPAPVPNTADLSDAERGKVARLVPLPGGGTPHG